MKSMRTWHILLIPIPVFGWLLLAALLADEFEISPQPTLKDPSGAAHHTEGHLRKAAALGLDIALAAALWTILPPALGWLLGACLLLCRDVGPGGISLGRLCLGECKDQYDSVTSSFERNLPLLVPYIGPITELVLLSAGYPRLGDRLSRPPRRDSPATLGLDRPEE